MSQVEVTQYDQRLSQILDKSQELFAEVGYDKVSVQKIIDKVGIAKGTFYHYFSSKEELLNAIVIRFVELLLKDVRHIADEDSLSAVEKMNSLFQEATAQKFSGSNSKLMKVMFAIMGNPANAVLVDRIMKGAESMVAPLYELILKQGNSEGVFSVEYPTEVAEMITPMFRSLSAKYQNMFALKSSDHITAEYLRITTIIEQSMERLLGTNIKTFHFTNDKLTVQVSEFILNLQK
jgi:AcrR family transcriptional regulator